MADNTQGTDTPGPTTVTVPDKPGLEGLEGKFSAQWRRDGTFRFDRDTERAQVYSIDTPPPTASGSLHVGHMFSYTQTDVVARYQRMTGKNVFYPMGWDDNGLPTERRVQNYFGVRCDPTLPHDPDYTPPEKPAKNERDYEQVSRKNFIELCERLAVDDEKVFEDLFTRLGLSVDWDLTYRTIDDHSRRVAQKAFLHDLAAGNAYLADAPTLWDVTFRTAVAQAELEDRERPGAYHRVAFHRPGGEPVHIESTRPELLPACVALVAHPDDERYRPLFGTTVTSPLFEVEVPVVAHPLAKPDKGSGIAMICTFGDLTDVTWWRELELPTRPIVGRDGRILAETPEWIRGEGPEAAYAELAGKTVFSAKEKAAELLRASGDLDGEPKPTVHAVNFYEKGDKPLEVVTSRQWYIRNGGREAQRRQRMLTRGAELNWHPSFMKARYDDWVGGLNGDWLISRQRFFGVPIPVWYPLDAQGEPVYDSPVVPAPEQLPVDPAAEPAPGYDESQRDVPGGFTGDPDVFDTWATSSLSPQIVTGWEHDPDLHAKTYPMDLRPQAHEIIRTWLFSSVVRADSLTGALPWTDATISGWVLDPDRKKMSKSKGNVVVPTDTLDKFGSDAVRYWAASARLGADTAFDEGQIKIGRRLAIKLLNASKFVLAQGVTEDSVLGSGTSADIVTNPLDRALLAQLATVVERSTAAMQDYEYARALQNAEQFFWTFTDDYVELVKDRAYGARGQDEQASVHAALATTLDAVLRLFAPFLPFATDEVWSWWRTGSVHRAAWPAAGSLSGAVTGADPEILTTVGEALSGLRKAKSEAKVKQRTAVRSATITAPAEEVAHLEAGLGDLRAAGNAEELTLVPGAEGLSVRDVELAPAEEPVR